MEAVPFVTISAALEALGKKVQPGLGSIHQKPGNGLRIRT